MTDRNREWLVAFNAKILKGTSRKKSLTLRRPPTKHIRKCLKCKVCEKRNSVRLTLSIFGKPYYWCTGDPFRYGILVNGVLGKYRKKRGG